MRAYTSLPDSYQEIYSVNLQKNKKESFWINFWAIVIGVIMVTVPWVTISNPLDMSYWQLLLVIVLNVVYIILHELVHGVTMKAVGTKKVKYGFTGLYAFAGSKDYYDKSSYITIALAPVVFWGVVLAIVQIFTPVEWFWVPWLIQVSNISGAAGDAYVTAKFSKMPKDILVSDYGVGMTVYSQRKSK